MSWSEKHNIWSEKHNIWSEKHNLRSEKHNLRSEKHNIWSEKHNLVGKTQHYISLTKVPLEMLVSLDSSLYLCHRYKHIVQPLCMTRTDCIPSYIKKIFIGGSPFPHCHQRSIVCSRTFRACRLFVSATASTLKTLRQWKIRFQQHPTKRRCRPTTATCRHATSDNLIPSRPYKPTCLHSRYASSWV